MGQVFRLAMPWGTNDYRVDEVNRHGHVTRASYRVADVSALRAVLGEWDQCKNVNVLRRLTECLSEGTQQAVAKSLNTETNTQ